MASAGTITVDLKARTASFETDMQRASRAAAKRSKEIEASAKRMGVALGLAFTAAATAVVYAVKQAIDNADKLNDISIRLGIGAEALSTYAYAAKQSGTDIESLSTGLTRFTKNIAAAADAGSSQGKVFAALGVDVKDAAGNLRSVEDLLPEIADRFKTLKNPTLESALAL